MPSHGRGPRALAAPRDGHPTFFFTLVTGPRRSLSSKLSDTRVYEPFIRARLGNHNTSRRASRQRCSPRRSTNLVSVCARESECVCERKRGRVGEGGGGRPTQLPETVTQPCHLKALNISTNLCTFQPRFAHISTKICIFQPSFAHFNVYFNQALHIPTYISTTLCTHQVALFHSLAAAAATLFGLKGSRS